MALKREQTASMFDNLKNASVAAPENVEIEQPKTTSKKISEPKTTSKVEAKAKKSSIKPELESKAVTKVKETVEENDKIKENNSDKEDLQITNNSSILQSEIAVSTKIEKIEPTKNTVKGFDFGGNKTKENKSVRKQFVFTPTYAEWLKKTAELNGISENRVIENLIKMAMDMQ